MAGRDMSSFTDLKGWCLTYPFSVTAYNGYGFADCILGAHWGTIICLGVAKENGIIVLAVSNANDKVYRRKINNTGAWSADWADW